MAVFMRSLRTPTRNTLTSSAVHLRPRVRGAKAAARTSMVTLRLYVQADVLELQVLGPGPDGNLEDLVADVDEACLGDKLRVFDHGVEIEAERLDALVDQPDKLVVLVS
jgi:hypothetical protein